MKHKDLVRAAHWVSLVFSPFLFPAVAFVVLLYFTYLSYMPVLYNLRMVGIVFLFTALLPLSGIFLYLKHNVKMQRKAGLTERKLMPYLISIASYGLLLYMMHIQHLPQLMLGIIKSALAVLVIGAALVPWLKMSMHAAALGGVIGALQAFALLIGFNPIWILCVCILLSGVVCSACLVLHRHTLTDMGVSLLTGIICGFAGVMGIL